MKKLFFIFLFSFFSLGLSVFNSKADFVLTGVVGKDNRTSSNHGTWCDEWAMIGMAARKKVNHGGYFCPYQFQCENRNDDYHSWIRYIYPSGYSCIWLCEEGYFGENCSQSSSTPSSCDNSDLTENKGKYIIKNSGEDSEMLSNSDIVRKNGSWTNPWSEESYEHYGITELKKHGAIAEYVRVYCEFTRYGSFCNKGTYESWVNQVEELGTEKKLLCARGYKPNSSRDDCEPINSSICEYSSVNLCSGFSKEKFDKANHKFEEKGDCSVILCKDSNKSLTSESDYSCIDCVKSKKEGIDKNTGLCIKCDIGSIFDSETNSCKKGESYTASDLKYGKGKNKESEKDVKKQCWTIQELDKYVECVKGN